MLRGVIANENKTVIHENTPIAFDESERNFWAYRPTFRDFLGVKLGPMFTDFCVKSTHLGGTSPHILHI